MDDINYIINEDGAYVTLTREWLPPKDANSLFLSLKDLLESKWNQETLKLYGKEILQPRLTYVCGTEGTIYQYSGLNIKVNKWIPEVEAIKIRIENELETSLNSCMINGYRNGQDYIAYHSDKEADNENHVVATVSLGGSRDFYFKDKRDTKRETIKTTLKSGDCVVMLGRCQELFTHSIPKRSYADYRISLTYRRI